MTSPARPVALRGTPAPIPAVSQRGRPVSTRERVTETACASLITACLDDIDPRAVLTDRQRQQLRSALWRLFWEEWNGDAWRALQESRAM